MRLLECKKKSSHGLCLTHRICCEVYLTSLQSQRAGKQEGGIYFLRKYSQPSAVQSAMLLTAAHVNHVVAACTNEKTN